MSSSVTIIDTTIPVIEYEGQRVITHLVIHKFQSLTP